MSGPVRPNTSRARSRSALASPYARPPKKSSWSFSNFLGFLNPLRSQPSVSRSPTPPDPTPDTSREEINSDEESSDEENHPQAAPGQEKQFPQGSSQSVPGPSTLPLPSPHRTGLPQPSTPLRNDQIIEDDSPAKKNIDQIASFLSTKAGQTISEMEMLGVISLLQKTAQPEPFRFESRSPSTPARGDSPVRLPTTTTPTSSPRKTLPRNPNGSYRWEGGGSARTSRTRNRYSSPAFGPSRATPERIVLKDSTAEAPRADTKRRRVGEEASTSSASPSGPPVATSSSASSKNTQTYPFPVSSPPVTPRSTTGATPKPAVTAATSRLRTPALQKPTTPAIPSPLRQAWSEGSTSSQSDAGHAQAPPVRQTKAANFMAELIKEVTPPRKPDVSNPYQMASPISKVTPRRPVKRTRATGRPPVPSKEEREKAAAEKAEREKQEKEKEEQKAKQYSPQAIIEATLPKGSKRSRPPAHFEKSPEARPAALQIANPEYVVEEVDDDEEESKRTTKKPKPFINSSGPSRPTTSSKTVGFTSPTPEIVIEEVDDVEMDSSEKEKPTTTSSNGAPPPSKAVSPPSTRPLFGGFKSSSIPKEPSKLRFSVLPEGSSAPSSPASVEKVAVPEEKVPAPVREPPPAPITSSFSFATAPPLSDKMDTREEHATKVTDPKEAARALPINSLPTFTFTTNGISVLPSTADHAKARNDVKNLPVSSLPTFTFSHEAVKKAPAASASAVKGFDWGAAGAKAPAASAGSSWTCSTCMLSNPATATEKCTICDAPKPGASKPAAAAKGFDWSAAGIKPPSVSSATWTCSSCMLMNPATATDKCTVCDALR